MSFWETIKIKPVINAAGKMTYLGGSAVSPKVGEAIKIGAQSNVEMEKLREVAALKITKLVKSPSATIVASASAGIVQSIAGTITGESRKLIQQVPNIEITRREIVLQKPHAIDYGVPVTQLIRIGGGIPVEVGSSNRCNGDQLAAGISENTAAILFVVSHHVQAESMVNLDEVVKIARKSNVPVIVDAAAESDLKKYLDLGADIVIYSGHKAIGGPTSGIVLGKPELIKSCTRQEIGIGRAMKVSKESITGLLVALEDYVTTDASQKKIELEKRLEIITSKMKSRSNLNLEVIWDKTRPIPRLEIKLHNHNPAELVKHFKDNDPPIWTRNHKINLGIIEVDPREINSEGAQQIADSLDRFLSGAKAETQGKRRK